MSKIELSCVLRNKIKHKHCILYISYTTLHTSVKHIEFASIADVIFIHN